MIYSVVIADDDLISRQFFEYTVSSSEQYQIAASFPDPASAAVFCRSQRPALVLIGISAASVKECFDAVRTIKKNSAGTKVILAASLPEVSWLKRAEMAGADSFWYKQFQDMPLKDILEKTVQGESVFPKKTPAVQIGSIRSDEFTARELEVLRELTTGDTSKVIAGKMQITEMTVRNHIINMLQKTRLRTRTELAVAARAAGIVVKD